MRSYSLTPIHSFSFLLKHKHGNLRIHYILSGKVVVVSIVIILDIKIIAVTVIIIIIIISFLFVLYCVIYGMLLCISFLVFFFILSITW